MDIILYIFVRSVNIFPTDWYWILLNLIVSFKQTTFIKHVKSPKGIRS